MFQGVLNCATMIPKGVTCASLSDDCMPIGVSRASLIGVNSKVRKFKFDAEAVRLGNIFGN